MGRHIKKSLTLSVFAAFFSTLMLFQSVFLPLSAAATSTPTTVDASHSIHSENPVNTPNLIATTTTTEDQNDSNTENAESTENNENNENNENTEENKPKSCYEQIQGLGWLVCPGTGLLANLIDGAYNILETLLKIDPIPNDENSPIYIVWTYLRNITNILFIIFFLVVIYSQITGLGITNYGIKRTLPRIIIAAILVNLSFLACTLAVDITNIAGSSLRDVFAQITDQAITNGTIASETSSITAVSVVSGLLGVGVVGGTVGVVGGLAAAGGLAGLPWLIIPVVLSGAIAVISAVITMAARQALVFLLVMVSPVAFILYLLPNTEKWFRKWFELLMRMLIFYPLFSVLFGASRLAGLITIASGLNSTDPITVILGLAIQVLPLFATFPLMRMSGTILGHIDGAIRHGFSPVQKIVGNRAAEGLALAKQKQLQSTSNAPHTRLAQWLEKRRAARRYDLKDLSEANEEKLRRYVYDDGMKRSRGKNKGTWNKRGIQYSSIMANSIRDKAYADNAILDHWYGLDDNGLNVRVRKKDQRKVQDINRIFHDGITYRSATAARQERIERQNILNREKRIRDKALDAKSRVHSIIAEANRFDLLDQQTNHGKILTEQEKLNFKNESLSKTMAYAVSEKQKADALERKEYDNLFKELPTVKPIKEMFKQSLYEQNYNKASAAAEALYNRSRAEDVSKILDKHSHALSGNEIAYTHLAGTLMSMKGDNPDNWAWGKALMKRINMNANGAQVEKFIEYSDFMSNKILDGDIDVDNAKKLRYLKIMEKNNSPEALVNQDKSSWKAKSYLLAEGRFNTKDLGGTYRQYAYALGSGKNTGEKLKASLDYITANDLRHNIYDVDGSLLTSKMLNNQEIEHYGLVVKNSEGDLQLTDSSQRATILSLGEDNKNRANMTANVLGILREMKPSEMARIQPQVATQLTAAIITNELDQTRTAIQNDTSISDSERTKKLGEFDKMAKQISDESYKSEDDLINDLAKFGSNLVNKIKARTVTDEDGNRKTIAISQDIIDATQEQRANLGTKNANNVRGNMFTEVKDYFDIKATVDTRKSTIPPTKVDDDEEDDADTGVDGA